MNKTLLIVIGIYCAVITAAGIMQFKPHTNPTPPIPSGYYDPELGVYIIPCGPTVTYTVRIEDPEAEKFSAIDDFYHKEFPDSHFLGGGVFTDGPSDNMRYHIFIPKEIETFYLYPYSESFLNKQLGNNDHLIGMIAANLLQLRHGVLFKRPGATESYDGGKHNIECIDYATPFKYYLLDNPDKKSIPDIKELLNDEDKNVREQAEQILKKLGVSEEEIEKAKEQK